MDGRKLIHEWKNWLLEHIGEDNYELIKKNDLTVLSIVAKDDMSAENQCQKIIKNEKKPDLKANGTKMDRMRNVIPEE